MQCRTFSHRIVIGHRVDIMYDMSRICTCPIISAHHIHMHVHIYMHIHIYICIYIYVYTYTCACTCTCTCTCTRTHTHTNTHTYNFTIHKLLHRRRMYTNTNPCRSQAVWYNIDLQNAILCFMHRTIHWHPINFTDPLGFLLMDLLCKSDSLWACIFKECRILT